MQLELSAAASPAAAAAEPALGAPASPAVDEQPSPDKRPGSPSADEQPGSAAAGEQPGSPAGSTLASKDQDVPSPAGPRCPACGACHLTEEEMKTVRKPGRRSTRDANDPRNRPENLVTREFLHKHIMVAGMSLRDIGAYHGYTISTLSRRAKQERVQVGARARTGTERTAGSKPAAAAPAAAAPAAAAPATAAPAAAAPAAAAPAAAAPAAAAPTAAAPTAAPPPAAATVGGDLAGADARSPAPTPPRRQQQRSPALPRSQPLARVKQEQPPQASPAKGEVVEAAKTEEGEEAEERRPLKRQRRPTQKAQQAEQQELLAPLLLPLPADFAAAVATAAATRHPPLLPALPPELLKLDPAAVANAHHAQLARLFQGSAGLPQLELWQQAAQASPLAAAPLLPLQPMGTGLPLQLLQQDPAAQPALQGLQQAQQVQVSPVPQEHAQLAQQPGDHQGASDDEDHEAVAGLVSLRHRSAEPLVAGAAAAAEQPAAAAGAAATGAAATEAAERAGAAPGRMGAAAGVGGAGGAGARGAAIASAAAGAAAAAGLHSAGGAPNVAADAGAVPTGGQGEAAGEGEAAAEQQAAASTSVGQDDVQPVQPALQLAEAAEQPAQQAQAQLSHQRPPPVQQPQQQGEQPWDQKDATRAVRRAEQELPKQQSNGGAGASSVAHQLEVLAELQGASCTTDGTSSRGGRQPEAAAAAGCAFGAGGTAPGAPEVVQQQQPGAPETVQQQPGAPETVQQQPGAPETVQQQPGGCWAQQQGGAAGAPDMVQQQQPGASSEQQQQPGGCPAQQQGGAAGAEAGTELPQRGAEYTLAGAKQRPASSPSVEQPGEEEREQQQHQGQLGSSPERQERQPPATSPKEQQQQPHVQEERQQQSGGTGPSSASPAPVIAVASSAGGFGGCPTDVAQGLQRVCAQAAQHVLSQAVASFKAVDMDSSESMLRPLRRLLLAGQGGATLQGVVARWAGYSLSRQRDIFSTAVLAASQARWEQLEDELKLALELAA